MLLAFKPLFGFFNLLILNVKNLFKLASHFIDLQTFLTTFIFLIFCDRLSNDCLTLLEVSSLSKYQDKPKFLSGLNFQFGLENHWCSLKLCIDKAISIYKHVCLCFMCYKEIRSLEMKNHFVHEIPIAVLSWCILGAVRIQLRYLPKSLISLTSPAGSTTAILAAPTPFSLKSLSTSRQLSTLQCTHIHGQCCFPLCKFSLN